LLAQDLDNDSWTDLIMFGDQGVSVLQGGPEKLELLKLEKIAAGKIDGLTLAEMNGDGLYDLCYISDGKLLFAANVTSDAGNYIDVQMKGIDDNATGRVNHFAIGSVFELRFGPHYRAKTVTERTTHFGIGKLDAADTLRAILTNGITQNIIDPKINVTLVEEQTNKGSCPFLYGWDGEKFAFVTDCLWAAPLGLQYAMGKVIPDRPWEYLKVDGKFLSPRDGHYEIRLTEELWEVAYFDHVSLIAVDHPADVEIWTNEKVGPPDVVQPTTFAIRNGRKVVSAVDTSGNDCASLLENRDQQYVKGFDQRLRLGLCPPHWVDLDLGPVEANDRVLLIMTGWILPTDTSLNIQIDQNPNLPAVEPPAVWIPGQGSEGSKTDGEWELAIPAMGFPGGKTKTIVVDLTGKLNADDPRVRIKTNAQIYWDAAEVVVNPESVEVVSTALTMVDARVAYRGFSAILRHDIHQSPRYDYHQASKAAKWPPLAGRVTREGDCLSMLAEWDDEMVVLGSGDEIQIRFEVPTDPLPEGWTRDFVLHSVGWDKDADLNTLHGQNIGPLPFKAMTAYPPKPSDADAAERVERINEWQLTREQNFRKFWYKPVLN
jgi:hypothetical protein